MPLGGALRCSRWLPLVAAGALLAACAGDAAQSTDAGGPRCESSSESGLWLLPFGPVLQEVVGGSSATLTVVVVRGSAREGEGSPEAGQTVGFRIININPAAGVSLDRNEAATDADGLAAVSLGAEPTAAQAVYQVEASLGGTCPQTFSIDVKRPLRQLRPITPSPFDTFTHARVPIAVQATTNGFAKLAGEDITFKLGLGKSPGTSLTTGDAAAGSDTVTIKTSSNGQATAMLLTGPQPISQLQVVASMTGTADAVVQVRIAQGAASPCKEDFDCPLAYTCKNNACEAPPLTPPGGCTGDEQCPSPSICHKLTGQCMEPTGSPCDPIEGTGCQPNEVCVGGRCAKLPDGPCGDHGVCPGTFKCVAGSCVPQGQPPGGGCGTVQECAVGHTCLNGQCVPKSSCNLPHAADRLKGTWKYDSTLHLRDALGGVTKGLLGAAGMLRDIIEGRFKISGIPGFISDIVSKYLKKLIGQYVPPWGQQLIVALGNVNDIVDDMRVLSTVQKNPAGPDSYLCNEQWDLIEFDYKGQKISAPPSAIPEVGEIKVKNYYASEVCGTLLIDKHKVQNKVGGLIKWAIETGLSVATCNIGSGPCFNSVEQALGTAINCPMLAMQLDQLVMSVWSSAPSIASMVEMACEGSKTELIKSLNGGLQGLTTKLSLMSLSGTVAIPPAGQENQLTGGKWYGGLGGGSFDGEFSAAR